MTRKKYKVILAEHADRMLLAHTEFLARVSIPAARKLICEFKDLKNNLSINPHQYPYADDLDVPGIPPNTYRKGVFFGRYKALFLIENSAVYIDAIIDCRQDNKDIYGSQ